MALVRNIENLFFLEGKCLSTPVWGTFDFILVLIVRWIAKIDDFFFLPRKLGFLNCRETFTVQMSGVVDGSRTVIKRVFYFF